jgi:hypothetical protein
MAERPKPGGHETITCRHPIGCTRQGGANGLCTGHNKTWNQKHTSDGVMTGPKFKLSDEQITEARRMLSAFKSKVDIARHFGVTTETLNRAFRRNSVRADS